MKYMVIEVIERTICQPQFFNNLEDAKKELREMAEDIKEPEFICEEMVAYGETANHDNWDAEIFEIEI